MDYYYYYESQWPEFLNIAISILIVLAVVFFAIAVVCYVFEAIALYTIAKRRGIQSPGLAWVPVGNSWLLGSIADDYTGKTMGTGSKYRFLLLFISAGEVLLSVVVGLAPLMSLFILPLMIAAAVFVYMALFKVYESCSRENKTVYLVLSIVFPIAIPFFLFALRNKDSFVRVPYGAPVPPPYGQPPYGQAPYDQPPYGQPPYGQPPYGQPPYGQAPYAEPSHDPVPPGGQVPSDSQVSSDSRTPPDSGAAPQ